MRNFTWVALAGCSSALFLGVTNALSQNVAPMPLLWVAPLALYLISFALCFDREGLFKPALYRILIPPALIALLWAASDPKATCLGRHCGLFSRAVHRMHVLPRPAFDAQACR